MRVAVNESPHKDVLPLASVIIPVYNDQEGLLGCLQALSVQTYGTDRFEVIIVDNASKPAIRIEGSHPFHMRLVECEVPGSYAARNVGARLAAGDILAFTDADCAPCSEWIERGVETLLAGEGRRIVGGEVKIAEPRPRSGAALYQYATGFRQEANIKQKAFTVTANLLCTREQFQAIGPFDERLLSGGDREWSWRAAEQGFVVAFEPRAIVNTPPRATLRSAIRQARRVAAGRHRLQKYGLDYLGPEAIAPHRSLRESFFWILTNRQLSYLERFRVLYAASVIKAATTAEAVRLFLGGKAERR